MNLLQSIPTDRSKEVTEVLVESGSTRVERIVSHGQASPAGFWYNQSEHEWVMVLTGEARMRFEDKVVDLKSGDSIDIPPRVKHRVDSTSATEPTIWLAVFFSS
ncbi:MAG: hypothetical protein KVP17_003414 [Porospora cf. gigantea B]|uniref:uncharacterized protein n=1 Tax=Porospora cf. gigantea B TaxID=2853592 RepID=UPI003571D90B|nr:MAG: hypothetical protein KVP17_003414 [Porospora cf. gigantea B]